MTGILEQISKVRQKLKRNAVDALLAQKPFAKGMYSFSMFMISYYSRVSRHLKLDYDSFMIVQTVVGHSLYLLNKKKPGSASYDELEMEWEKLLNKDDLEEKVNMLQGKLDNPTIAKNKLRLTISSICLVTSLPKETVRRKVGELIKKNLLIMSKKNGILLGSAYKKVFSEFTPQTTKEVTTLIKRWNKYGILKSILNFKI